MSGGGMKRIALSFVVAISSFGVWAGQNEPTARQGTVQENYQAAADGIRAAEIRKFESELMALATYASNIWKTVDSYIGYFEKYATNNYQAARLANYRALRLETWQWAVSNKLARTNAEMDKLREAVQSLDAGSSSVSNLIVALKLALASSGGFEAQKAVFDKSMVAQKLQGCKFLMNGQVKQKAKIYLCLFSASWCGPCRAEMPRIAKTYAETLKDDPDIELIHFSCDRDDGKAMAWAKEHDVKFPVVKPKGGNPLNLHARGIPHLFIVKADGTLLEEGHPMRLFNEAKFRELKQ